MVKECIKRDKKEIIRKGKEITDPECDLEIYSCKFRSENDKICNNLEGLSVIKFASEKWIIFGLKSSSNIIFER